VTDDAPPLAGPDVPDPTPTDGTGGENGADATEGKRVSWVELYFDLVFVFAVSQAAHDIAVRPDWRGVGIALGLFATLWWTWIGYVVLYNRHSEDRPARRLFVLAGTLPCAIAAVELHAAPEGGRGFALALAGARLVLAVAYPASADHNARMARRIGTGYALSTVLFAVSALVPTPWRYVIWALALVQEAGFLLLDDLRTRTRARARAQTLVERREQRSRAARPAVRQSRADTMAEALRRPIDPDRRLDAPHLAERFGLFMIILLGEIVISVGSAALGIPEQGWSFWVGLLSGLVLAAALWWIYFDSAAYINEYVLRASNGNPTVAYGIYAAGHLSPAFALLAIAAGVNLSLHDQPPTAAAWLVSGGLAAYLVGSRAFLSVGRQRFGRLIQVLTLAATVNLAQLHRLLPATAVIAILALWAVGAATIVSARRGGLLARIAANPLSIFDGS
jgi:low temperature requirement protein LtrA